MLYLVLSISYECFARYLFDAPTAWVLDTSYDAPLSPAQAGQSESDRNSLESGEDLR